MRKIVILFCLITSSNVLLGQAREPDEEKVSENPKQNFGLGMGIDYGGLGGRFTYMTTQKFGLFVSVGYNIVGVGFNGGITYKFIPGKRVSPTIGAMYGYNGVIKVEDRAPYESSSTYYGPSFCLGIEVKNRKNESNYWNFEIVLPIRSSDFKDEIDRLQSIGYNVTEPLPITVSIGYHFAL